MPPFNERRIDARLVSLARETGDRTFLIFPDEGIEINYRDFFSTARRYASFLDDSGLKPGETLGMMLPNSSTWVKFWFGAILHGNADVGIHHGLKGPMLAHQLRRGRCRFVVCNNEAGLEALRSLRDDESRNVSALILAGEPASPELEELATGMSVRIYRAEEAEKASPIDPAPRDPNSLMSVRFTSGTTGPAKAGTLSMSQVCVWAAYLVQLLDFRPPDRIYVPFPLHHHLASIMGVMGALVAGGTAIIDKHFSARAFWRTATEHRATVGLMLDPVVRILLATAPSDYDHLHTIRRFYIARPSPEFEQRFGSRIQTAYALTEASVLAYAPPEIDETLPNCVGYPNPHFDIGVVDENDDPVETGETGEIVFRPRFPGTTMESYLDDPAATLGALRTLWFHTGDLGKFDEDGRLFFFERMGDTIRRRGVNIASFHIEEAALAFPGVKEAAAVGVPSQLGEFEVKLSVSEETPGAVDARALTRFLITRLPMEMVPRFLEIRDDFVRTHTEKIVKRALRDEGIGEHTISTEKWLGDTE
jgi:crotonobetaine/carnitine-CoA ligase